MSSFNQTLQVPSHGGQATVRQEVVRYLPIGYAGIGGSLATKEMVISESMYPGPLSLGRRMRILAFIKLRRQRS
jgi:hypothetical protein